MTTIAATTPTADEREVHDLVRRLYAAWGDADAYAGCFTEDADYVAFDGSHARGRRAIADMHRPLFERFLKGSRLLSVSEAIRFPAPGVALIHGQGAVLMARQRRPGRGRLSVQTLVAVKHGEEWRLSAFQNTRYRPFTETLIGKLLTLLGRAPGKD